MSLLSGITNWINDQINTVDETLQSGFNDISSYIDGTIDTSVDSWDEFVNWINGQTPDYELYPEWDEFVIWVNEMTPDYAVILQPIYEAIDNIQSSIDGINEFIFFIYESTINFINGFTSTFTGVSEFIIGGVSDLQTLLSDLIDMIGDFFPFLIGLI